jgi:uncharacterized membrane protein
MGIALASLVSALVALYLHLWKIGLTGSLACSSGNGCMLVQGSRYGWFLGVDVALIGAVVSTLPRFENERAPNSLMQLMIWPAVLFTIRLKYGEFIVIESFCSWCMVSTVVITLCAILITLDRRRLATLDSESDELQAA